MQFTWEHENFMGGEGIRIGILDTGVNYYHVDLWDREPEGFPNSKVVGGGRMDFPTGGKQDARAPEIVLIKSPRIACLVIYIYIH